jgi:CheY-like chemotaxis protein
MRPKKTILLADADDARLSYWSFRLATWGYRVEVARSGAEAQAFLEDMPYVVMIAAALGRMTTDVPTLVFSPMSCEPPTYGSVFLCGVMFTPMLVRERLRVLCQRKTGPKKGWKQAIQQEAA